MYMYVYREMHVYTGCIGGLLTNTVYILYIEVTVSVLLRLDSPHLSGQLHGKLRVLRARP